MIEDNTTWYLGTVGNNSSYKLSKYIDENGTTLTTSKATAKVGLLRYGELMSGQFDIRENNTYYWLITPNSSSYLRYLHSYGSQDSSSPTSLASIKPSLNLKQNVIITGGSGTKNNPFTIELSS